MDVIHVVLSSEMLTTKVFSLRDLLLAIGAVVLCVILVVRLKQAVALRLSANNTSNFLQRRKVKPRKQIADIADSLNKVVNHLVHSQYVMKDKARYSSVFQTPLRDSLLTLKGLSEELQRSANYVPNFQTDQNFLLDAYSNSQTKNNWVSTHQVVEDILPAIKDYAEREQMRLKTDERAHGFLDLATGLAEKMLRELLLNAVKHNAANTDILLRCSFTETHAVFEVQDNGKGIKAKDVAHALRPETQAEGLRSRRLSDAETQVNLRAIAIQAHQVGGELDIVTALNHFTRIRLVLPANSIAPRPKYLNFIETKPVQMPARSSRKKLLIVSKHNVVANIISEYFNDTYSVYNYRSFDKALAALFDVKPDIVIADFSWQHALGIQFCQFLRGSSAFSQVPFVMVTMAIDQSTRVKMYASGVTAIIEKPLDPQELSTIVNNIASNQQIFKDEVREASAAYVINSKLSDEDASQSEFARGLTALVELHYQQEEFNRFKAASALHISEKTLQRRMSEFFDMPFGQYLRKYRLERARALLLQGHLITEVTFEVGFNSTSYFGQCFKQEFGYPPSLLSKAYG